MKLEVLIQLLRNREEELCSIAADELEKLNDKYQELGRSYDAMSADLLRLANENDKLWKKYRSKNVFSKAGSNTTKYICCGFPRESGTGETEQKNRPHVNYRACAKV